MRSNIYNSLSDAYFIFADDTFVNKIKYDNFLYLIKFYSLLYKRIIIPDSFLINNIHLHKFFIEDEGKNFLKSNIISFTMREEISDMSDLLNSYIHNKTLKDNVKTERIKQITDSYNFSNSLRWNMTSISNNFSENILNSYSSIELVGDENKKLEYILNELNIHNNLTRKNIYDEAYKNFNDLNKVTLITNFADIIYNFNIPNLLNLSSAYPDRLLSNSILSPEKVFFGITDGKDNIKLQTEDLFSEDTVQIEQPLIFYTKILDNLTFDDIIDIRSTSEFKEYIKSLESNNSRNMITAFDKYLNATNILISQRLYKHYNDIRQIDSKIEISNKIENSTQKVIGLVMNFIPMSSLLSTPTDYIISKCIQITGKKSRKNLSMDKELLRKESNINARRLIMENPNTILKDMNNTFQINKLR